MTGKTVYLHVGPEKTGTTSLQNALFNSREELLRHGIRYWSISANHSWPLVLLLHSNTTNHPGFRESLFEHETVRYGSAETIRKQLTDELKASERFVISGEIASHLPEADLLKLHELLRISGAITKIVYYVREPRGWLNSVVLQRLKAGVPIDDAIAVNRRLPYRKTIEQLDRLFGKDNVRLRLYTQHNDPSQNLMADFLDAIGLPKELSAQFPLTWENAAMSETIAQILDSICRLAQAEGDQPLYGWFVGQFLEPIFQGPPYRLDAAVLNAVVDENADQIGWLEERMGRKLASVQPEPTARTPVEPVNESMARLIRRLTAELQRSRAATSFQRGLVERQRGDVELAYKNFASAHALDPTHKPTINALKQMQHAKRDPTKPS